MEPSTVSTPMPQSILVQLKFAETGMTTAPKWRRSFAPTCTDADGDGFAVEGGHVDPVDCLDTNAAVNPSATEVCGNGHDDDCQMVTQFVRSDLYRH